MRKKELIEMKTLFCIMRIYKMQSIINTLVKETWWLIREKKLIIKVGGVTYDA